jgi:hypothetical protein
MTAIFLAGLPLALAAGFLTWTMTMGAREQARSDAYAKEWAEKNHS